MPGNKAQVSIEILLLAGIVIFLSVTVFSFYTRISETTTAVELTKVELLRWIDEEQGGSHSICNIEYTITGDSVDWCVFTEPKSPALFSNTDYYSGDYLSSVKLPELKTKLTKDYGLFSGMTVNIYHNPPGKNPTDKCPASKCK